MASPRMQSIQQAQGCAAKKRLLPNRHTVHHSYKIFERRIPYCAISLPIDGAAAGGLMRTKRLKSRQHPTDAQPRWTDTAHAFYRVQSRVGMQGSSWRHSPEGNRASIASRCRFTLPLHYPALNRAVAFSIFSFILDC